MSGHRILVVEDTALVRRVLCDFLRQQGYEVAEAATAADAVPMQQAFGPDCIVSDYSLPDGDALGLLPRFKENAPEVPIIILTGHGSIDLAVRAIKLGAEQFLTKPVELAVLGVLVERAIANVRGRKHEQAEASRENRKSIDPFLGRSAAIRRLAQEASRVAGSESPVLIRGETGTGKGVLAAWLHRHGPRASESLVDLNCAGLSRELLESELFGHERGSFTGAVASKPGLLEIAHRGTVFLDEIGDMDPAIQPRLLKVLEEKRFHRVGDVRERRVDIRLIAATHRDLAALGREGAFRSDLYFRISTLPLMVPSLRERPEDIPELARNLLHKTSAEMGRSELTLADDAVAALQAYPWPGNIRELRNVLERASLYSDSNQLRRQDLRFEPVSAIQAEGADTGDGSLEDAERRHIERALRTAHGRMEVAARALKISKSALYAKVKRLGLRAEA
ncbi:MAG: sigma-54 dependent transcriptional regulator [Vicinamibacteria bacterium]|nr:sigma-54 dependent transcriptional regulator [Vicinamibacteria bacterium]